MGAGEALPGWRAVGEDVERGGQAMAGVGVGEDWASAEAGGGTADRAGAGEGGVARALGPGQEAGLQASEAFGEPRSWWAGAWRLEPGRGRLSGSDEETRAEGRPAGVRGGTGGAEADWGCWTPGVEGSCSSPRSSPDCALGLTP